MKILKQMAIMGTCLFGLLAVFNFFPKTANAHPPASVELAYNIEKQVLEVKITHISSFPNQHYVKKVAIKKNGEVVGGGDYQSQPDKESFTYTYTLAAAAGDLLEVTATCSVFGSKITELKVQ